MADTPTAASRPYTRWQAAGIHLFISACVAALALFVLLRIWYPPPFFTGESGSDLPGDLKQLRDFMAERQKDGKAVTNVPRYFVPYAAHKTQALEQSQSLDAAIKRGGDFSMLAEKYLAYSGRKATELKYIPLQMRRGFGAVLLDARSGEIVTLIPPKL